MVGGQTERFANFNKNKRKVKSFPGCRVNKVTEEVEKPEIQSRNSCVIAHVGSNDLYLRGGRVGNSEPIVKDMKRLVNKVSEKTNKGYSCRNATKFCIVAGDFNCSVNWKTQIADAESMRLLDFANEEYLTQWVDKPTRGNNTLDLVFSSEDNMISKLSVGEKLGKSEHNMIRFEILTSFTKLEMLFSK